METVLAFVIGFLPGQPPPAISAELARQQGVWAVISFVRDGKEAPADVEHAIVREVTGDHVVWKRDGKSFAGTRIELDAATSPHAIDVIPDGGRSREKRVVGIYRLEGDRLTICMADPDQPRPTRFEAPQGSKLTLMTFRRRP